MSLLKRGALPNPPYEICFVAQHLSIGGIATRLLTLVRGIDRTRFRPVILCAEDQGALAEEFRSTGVEILVTRGLLPLPRTQQLAELIKLLYRRRGRRFDLMVSFLYTSLPFEIWLAKTLCPAGAFAYALVAQQRAGRSQEWRARERLARCIIAVSRQTAEYFYKATPVMAKVRIVHNGVDIERFDGRRGPRGRDPGRVQFCCVARITPEKRFDVLLDAVAHVVAQEPRFHLQVVGPDRMDGWLQAEIARRGLGAHVTYLGPRRDVADLLRAADGFVLTSDAEGCPNSVLEAMAMGLPVVVTRCGAEELVEDGVCGYTAPVANSVQLAERLATLTADAGLRTTFGETSRQRAETVFSNETMLRNYAQVFEELLSTPPSP